MAQIQFSDINLDFEPHPVTGDVVKLLDENAVKRSVRNLVFTNFYEHPYDRRLGSNIRDMLFENFGPEVEQSVKARVEYVLQKYEPRIELIDVYVDASVENIDRNRMSITITFFVGSSTTPTETTIMLERVR